LKLLDGGRDIALRVQKAYDAADVTRPPLDVLLQDWAEITSTTPRR
jgi:hypothetical protein